MNKIFDILEFDKIKELILKYNINDLSRKKVLELKPSFFYEEVKEKIDQSNEAYNLVTLGTFPNLALLKDLSDYLDIVSKNGILTIEQIYDFVTCLQICDFCKQFVLNNKLSQEKFFYTLKYINSLSLVSELKDQISYCISPNYTIYDHSSSKLKTIRNQIKKTENEIKDKLNSYLRNNSSMLSDNYIATRGTHYVLPVKAAYKNQIKGIVIDVSSSLATYFIEPYSVTENNVLLEQLRYEEEIEVSRIIKALCELINKYNNVLLANNNALKELSFMLLKGTYGLNNNYEIASLNENNEISIIGAYHPLIDINKVIKNDFYLGGDNNRIIVISGPNAGGKTVALKTIALIVLMNQCGLPLPIKKASLAVFRNIFVDIGDEQSIELSLSGFSSHMKNVSNILNNIDCHSLVIIDELASKTDPGEGEALAKAIIEYINDKKAIALISTHYIGIKDYAKENMQITLASMGFDEQNLSPTYKLLLNVVGKSYAFEISYRLGLDASIINKAKEYKSEASNNLDMLISDLSNKLLKENEIIASLNEKEKQLLEKIDEVNLEKEKLQNKYDKAISEINEKKEEFIQQAYIEVQQIVDDFKLQSKQEGFKHHLKNNAINKLDALSNVSDEKTHEDKQIKVNDDVKLISLNKICKVKDIKGSKVIITLNNTNMVVSLSDIEKVEIKESKQQKRQVKIASLDAMSKNVPLSLNLIGMRVEEALIALRNYIDAALLVKYSSVTIIHGYGTGALRKAVHEYLKNCKYVSEFTLGGYNQGGAGATIVTLKGKK